ncbi:MAG TPA: hypothetical protein VHM88_06140 [Candidatus Acidoferrales bacterium]|nr:hypothetical protein [Candidatus Acidoferrales bacterium]
MSVQCGAVGEERQAIPFTMYITMTSSTPGSVHVIYHDLNFVDYPILAGTTVQISLAGGSKPGIDDAIEVEGLNGAFLIGQASIITDEDARPNPVINTSLCTTTPAGVTPPFGI